MNDEGQTVELVPPETPEAPTPGGKLPQTGDELPIAGICALGAAGCAATVIGLARGIGLRREENEGGRNSIVAYIAGFLSGFAALAAYACCRASGAASRTEERGR